MYRDQQLGPQSDIALQRMCGEATSVSNRMLTGQIFFEAKKISNLGRAGRALNIYLRAGYDIAKSPVCGSPLTAMLVGRP